jgi:hypothetical protein
MPNAWFYYIVPLGIALVFFFAGLSMLLRGVRDRNAPAHTSRTPAKAGGVLLTVIGGSIAVAILFTSPTPSARQRLFDRVLHAAPDQVVKFVVRGDRPNQRPLTASDVTIDDPATIRQILEHLSSAEEVSLNHPRARWAANVEMVTRDGDRSFFTVNATEPGDPNGTLVNISYRPPGRSWNLGSFRADGVEAVLENAVRRAAKNRAAN